MPLRVLLKPVVVSLVVCQLFLGLAGCADTRSIKKPSYQRSSSNSKSRGSVTRPRFHVVKKGETLYRIAKRYRTTVAALKKANGISDSTKLEVGTKLRIVTSSSKQSRASSKAKPRSTKRSRRAISKSAAKAGFIWPLKKYSISSEFGIRGSKKHDGIDLSAPKGTPIFATASGKVIFSGRGPSGYGKIVIVKHPNNLISVYAHNKRNLVRQGESVKKAQKIATVGNSGRATGYHLHFEVRRNRKPVDPLTYLRRK